METIVLNGRNSDITGKRFGKLVAMRPISKTSRGLIWECQCDCGNIVGKRTELLVTGVTNSCGCLRGEKCAERNRSHGLAGTPEHVVWKGILARCHNPNHASYHLYGKRGVFVCQEWRDSFEAFLIHIGTRPSSQHTVERIDNSKGYEPENVKWATRKEQSRNKRNNRLIEFNGERLIAAEWSDRTGIPAKVISERIDKLGWQVSDALTTPKRKLTRVS